MCRLSLFLASRNNATYARTVIQQQKTKMKLTKQEYIIKQIAKTNKKKFENYVVTRLVHSLNTSEVKFLTQQYVKRPTGHALTDMYLPQIELHIEIDEPFHKKQVVSDLDRELDIINATNHQIRRIKITDSIENLNNQIDELLIFINSKIKESKSKGDFKPWNYEEEFDPNYWRSKGELNLKDNPRFRTILDACNCMGQNYVNCQKAFYRSKHYRDYHLWFPKFYENEDWDNSISDDGLTIREICKNSEKAIKHFENSKGYNSTRIVFPRSVDNLGLKLYSFKGIFKTDIDASSIEGGVIHRRINTKISVPKSAAV